MGRRVSSPPLGTILIKWLGSCFVTPMSRSFEQHNIEIQQNRESWAGRPLLRKVHSQFHREISHRLKPNQPGLIVELGSGIGSIKEHIPQCMTTDIFPNPWLDRVET